LEKFDRSADTPFGNILHILHLSQKWSPAGLLFLENIRSPFFSLLTNREIIHSNEEVLMAPVNAVKGVGQLYSPFTGRGTLAERK